MNVKQKLATTAAWIGAGIAAFGLGYLVGLV